jgi:hypothetical protein
VSHVSASLRKRSAAACLIIAELPERITSD